jgi:recombination protein RecA
MVLASQVQKFVLPEAIRAWAGASVTIGTLATKQWPALQVAPPLASALPDGGFPQGSVVELASPANLGHGLGIALAACAASQEASVRSGREMVWCAFLDPDRTLFGPAVQASGVCLDRLLVLRPPRQLLAKIAVKVALSRIFSVIVVDVAAVPGVSPSKAQPRSESMDAWAKVTRRLSLAVEKTPATVFLLTRSEAQRTTALPAAMRVELENAAPDSLVVRVAKEKFGRVTIPRKVAWTRPSEATFRRASG